MLNMRQRLRRYANQRGIESKNYSPTPAQRRRLSKKYRNHTKYYAKNAMKAYNEN